MYSWIILQYGNPSFLIQRPPPTLTITILISAFVGPVVQVRIKFHLDASPKINWSAIYYNQTFLAERIRLVSEGRILVPIICWVSSLALFVMEIFLYVQGERSASLPAFQAKCRWVITAVLGLSAAVDVLEAVSLCYYLNKMRKLSMGRWESNWSFWDDQIFKHSRRRTAVNIHLIMRWTMGELLSGRLLLHGIKLTICPMIETGLLKSMSEVSMLICVRHILLIGSIWSLTISPSFSSCHIIVSHIFSFSRKCLHDVLPSYLANNLHLPHTMCVSNSVLIFSWQC